MAKNKIEEKKNPVVLFVSKEKEPLFSKKNRALLSDPFNDNNLLLFRYWVFVQH